MASADVELHVEAETEEDHDGGVDADGQKAQVPGDDGRDDVVEAHLWEGAVGEVEWEGKEEAEGECEDDPLVLAADAEEVARESSECNCLKNCQLTHEENGAMYCW